MFNHKVDKNPVVTKKRNTFFTVISRFSIEEIAFSISLRKQKCVSSDVILETKFSNHIVRKRMRFMDIFCMFVHFLFMFLDFEFE